MLTKSEKKKYGWLKVGSFALTFAPLGAFVGYNWNLIFKTPETGLTMFGFAAIISAVIGFASWLGITKMRSFQLLVVSGTLLAAISFIPTVIHFAILLGAGMFVDDLAFQPTIKLLKKKKENNNVDTSK